MKLLVEIIVRDLRIHLRGASEMLNPLVFFVVVISLFPLGVGPSGRYPELFTRQNMFLRYRGLLR